MLEMERKNGILLLEHANARRAGCSCAGAGSSAPRSTSRALAGAAAVYEMVTWGHGSFDFLAGDVGGVDEIQASTTYLLMEGARRLDEAKNARKLRGEVQENKL